MLEREPEKSTQLPKKSTRELKEPPLLPESDVFGGQLHQAADIMGLGQRGPFLNQLPYGRGIILLRAGGCH